MLYLFEMYFWSRGMGEKIDDLEAFSPPKFVGTLLGLGDLESILKRIQEAGVVSEEEVMRAIMSGKFTLRHLYQQIQHFQGMGRISRLLSGLPGIGSSLPPEFDDMSKEKLFIYPHKIEWKSGKIPVAQKADFQTIPLDQKEPLKEELKHFIDCVNKRKSPKTDGYEGLSVLRILEQAENAMLRRSQRKSLDTSETNKYYLHESSFVDDNVIIGDATKIWHFSHILSDSKIGKKCIIRDTFLRL